MSLFELRSRFRQGAISKADYIRRMAMAHAVLYDYSRFIGQTDISKIEISSDGVLITTKASQVKLFCAAQERRTAAFEILNFGYCEKPEMAMVLQLVGENSVFFDIGANMGWYALNLAKLVKGIRVLAFEPIPRTFGLLEGNIGLNGIENIETFNFGFSDKEGKVLFYYYPEDSGNASMANVSGKDDIQTISCQVRKLDDFVARRKIGPDFIKCDVEGAELLVLQGGEQTLAKFKPVVFVEMLRKWSAKFNYHPNKIIQLFSDLGYQCFAIQNGQLAEVLEVTEATVETNFFFLHPEERAKAKARSHARVNAMAFIRSHEGN